MSSKYGLISLIMLSALALSASGAKKFNFLDYFEGKWIVESQLLPAAEGSSGITIGNYELKKEDSALVGIYYENITGLATDYKNALRIKIETETPESGVFMTSRAQTDIFTEPISAEPDLNFKPLFTFDFVEHKNGIWVASGEWQGKKKGIYQLSLTSEKSFLLSVVPSEDPSGIQSSIGTKDQHKTVWEQYGPTVIIFLVFGASKVLQSFSGSKARRAQMHQRAAARAAAVAPSASATAETSAAGDKKSD